MRKRLISILALGTALAVGLRGDRSGCKAIEAV